MKKFYSLNRSWLILMLLLLSELNCEAQKKVSPEIQAQAASQVSFIVHASVDLPALLERK